MAKPKGSKPKPPPIDPPKGDKGVKAARATIKKAAAGGNKAAQKMAKNVKKDEAKEQKKPGNGGKG